MTLVDVFLVIGLLSLFPLFWLLCRRWNKREWNGGLCTECGAEMRPFDMDSGGDIGCKCDACGRTIWVGWLNLSKEKTVYKHRYFGKVGFEKEVE